MTSSNNKRQRIVGPSDYPHHPSSVLSSVTQNQGITDISLKTDTAVNYVLANDSLMKMFGLLRDPKIDPIDSIPLPSDLNEFNDPSNYESIINFLNNDLNELTSRTNIGTSVFESNAKSGLQKPEGLNLLEEIKNLSKEFSTPNEEDNEDETDAIEDNFHNDKIRSLYESQFNSKIIFVNNETEVISKSLPESTIEAAEKSGLKDHLRVVRLGPMKI